MRARAKLQRPSYAATTALTRRHTHTKFAPHTCSFASKKHRPYFPERKKESIDLHGGIGVLKGARSGFGRTFRIQSACFCEHWPARRESIHHGDVYTYECSAFRASLPPRPPLVVFISAYGAELELFGEGFAVLVSWLSFFTVDLCILLALARVLECLSTFFLTLVVSNLISREGEGHTSRGGGRERCRG